MKSLLPFVCAGIAGGGSMLPAYANPSADIVLANTQDARMEDVAAVQSAMEAASPAQKAVMIADFQVRDQQRAAEAGAASLQAELARQAARKAESPSPQSPAPPPAANQ